MATKRNATKKTAAEVTAEVKNTIVEESEKAVAALEKAAEETKKTASKAATTAKKTAAKTASAAKNTVKKAAKKAEPTVTATVEFYGKSVVVSDIVAKAEEAFKASHADTEISSIDLYIKPEENAAYYVLNGEGSADFKVEL